MHRKGQIDPELGANLDAAIAGGLIEQDSAAAGIAQQVIDDGVDSLSQKQRFIYERVIEPWLSELAKLLRASQQIARPSGD
jgi:hypothetical protein